jgi:hypothetical protein
MTQINGYELVNTCMACPEQYDVYKEGKYVGYLRLRHGQFRAENESGKVVYTAIPIGDGMFTPEEREKYLAEAIQAIENDKE